MSKLIMIKYGELSTKKGNRGFFINTLYKNIKNKLDGLDVNISKDRARMYIEFKDKDLDEIKSRIDKIFGIHEYDIVYSCDSNVESIKDEVLKLVKKKDFNTFKVSVKRSDKSFELNSQEMNRVIATHIFKNMEDIKVDVHNPDLMINVEIREKQSFIFFNKYPGLGGYPVGVQSKALLMLSGGIDSPVAGYLAMKRGIAVDCVYFEAIPHTSLNARNKVIELGKKLLNYTDKINIHIVNFTEIQESIYKNCKDEYVITIMRRMMYRIMERLCLKYKSLAIINGESIGQVASQTLESMNTINSVTNIPVIRPVACMDKLEIIDIARKIDTYEISILPYEDCCTVFVPKHPVIKPSIETCIEEENKFDYEKLIDKCIEDLNTIKLEKEEEKFDDLL
ncbi:MAG: tRNA 4-thiouridine(8) synthase ThiI [Bacilli bacterium]|nr:tRNA 4-thiouridine(8) synthase ThiI [Bacilli bacterium]